MDGLLVIDKPAGPTSHDVVARVRRALRERRIGHTGTLDPLATGVLPLVLGRATRLARFMSEADKTYDAIVRLGVRTDTADAEGQIVGQVHEGALPDRHAIERALDAFRGTFDQRPPAFSAKKIGGKKSYDLARSGKAPNAAAKAVTTHSLEVTNVDTDLVSVTVRCSAGFYVRALAHDLGERLGIGAHLAGLRRTRSGDFTLDQAVALDDVEASPAAALERVVPMGALLQSLGAVVLTPDGITRATHGREIGPSAWLSRLPSERPAERVTAFVRLLSASGELVGVARPGSSPDLLHPFVVLM
jgi:tRNA pseudouridine55 synthase